MPPQIVGAIALAAAAAVLPSAAIETTAGPQLASAADPNRNRYCDSFDPRPPSKPGPEYDVGNRLTAQVNTDIETVSVRSEAGPMWDSTIPNVDRYAIGTGWTMGEAFMDVTPYGVKVYVPGRGLLETDWSKVSGLGCYEGRDVVFSGFRGAVPARGEFPERAYEYSLQHFDETNLETPTRTDYFGANGEVMTTIAADGTRTDRVYDADQPQRVTRIVHDDGRETTLTYPDEDRSNLLTITSPDGATTTFPFDSRWRVPAAIVSPIGSTSFSWETRSLMVDLLSEDATGSHLAQFEWSPDDTGRLDALSVGFERVFPVEPNHR